MPLSKSLLYFVFVLLVVVGGNDYVPLQFNLHLTKWHNTNNENELVVQHDCLRIDAWEDKKNIYEITPYCMSEWPSEWQIQTTHSNQKFTFAQLSELNITSEELYRWSAPMDTVEDYQYYLDQLSISNKTLFSTHFYYNCTLPKFGPMCQYSFDQYKSSYSSLNEIIYQFYRTNQYDLTNQTCYRHLQCNLGFISLCIGWINVCDGIIQCIDAIDEEPCWQLEINECHEDEYRCQNGQCIPISFLNDNPNAPDCLDGSDEGEHYIYTGPWNPSGPLFKYEEIACFGLIHEYFQLRFGRKPECFDSYFLPHDNSVYFPEKPHTISDTCWLALNCYLKFRADWNSNCDDICQNGTCKQIIMEHCPDIFYMPDAPMAFGHIYFAYTKKYIVEQNMPSSVPEYICYNERLCGGFLSNKTVLLFNKTVCRHPQDFSVNIRPFETRSFIPYIKVVYSKLYSCNTILRNDSTFCDASTMYQCMNSSKCIAQIRLLDLKYDCDYEDDEIWISNTHSCPIKSHQLYVNCTETKTCISRKLLNDKSCQCKHVVVVIGSRLCDDEPSEEEYIRYHISFSTICDNITLLNPISINGQNETDETECEQWPCNNIYTRCDGIWNCFNGEDELDCYPSSLINCSLRSYVCFSRETADYMCLSADKLNDGNIDCLGTFDERQCCGKVYGTREYSGFYCNRTGKATSALLLYLCDERQDCWQEEDEKFCHHNEVKDLFGYTGVCHSKVIWERSDVEEFLCKLFNPSYYKPWIVHFSLDKLKKSDQHITEHDTEMKSISVLTTQTSLPSQNPCHRSPNFQIWLNNEIPATLCLCPPSYYGDRCQFQNERVSLTIRFRTFSDSWQTPFIVIVSLIDNSTERIIHSHEQFTYLPVLNCQTKFNIDLLYSTQPKTQSKQYFVHIDIYEKLSLSYRGSLLLSFPFPFLPVQRIAIQLNIPHTGYGFQNCSDQHCGHGQCVKYFDDPQHTTFCQCQSGWSGRYCNISHRCMCSSNSLCIGMLANNRSICVCPKHKWGSRCLLHDQACQSNATCHNGGQCIPVDKDIASKKKFTCICPTGFFGEACELSQNKIILSFEKDMILPQTMLIHFIEVKDHAHPENGLTFKTIPIDRSPVTIYWSRTFHITFVEFVPENYYLIVLQNIYNQAQTIETTLKSSNRCSNISEVFNETFFQFHLIRRIKYYHLPCRQHSPQLSCFYDDVHLCLCQDLNQQRVANCLEFNHRLERNCRGQSICENGASCLQDNVNCPKTSMCICPPCFYGVRCQFSSSGFGLSLDAILGSSIQPYVSISYQPVIVHISMTLTVLMTVMGLLNGICSIMTFMNKEPRKTGCGLYLLSSSITTLFTTIIFCVKFWILLAAQMTYMTDRSFLYFQCRSIDFLLRVGLHMDQWLNACIAIERAIMTIKGLSFDIVKSKKIAKFVILVLFLLTIGTNIPEIIYRRLLDDDSNDEKRIWCIVNYSVHIQKYNLAMNIFHFCTPFVINLLSAIIIIIKTARSRSNAKTQQTYRQVLLDQFRQHKHLLITPLLLVILAIPRLIISLVSGCMQTATDAWLFLMGYFISFIPPILTFFIFVAPSKTYKEEFYNTFRRYQRSIRTYFRLFR